MSSDSCEGKRDGNNLSGDNKKLFKEKIFSGSYRRKREK